MLASTGLASKTLCYREKSAESHTPFVMPAVVTSAGLAKTPCYREKSARMAHPLRETVRFSIRTTRQNPVLSRASARP